MYVDVQDASGASTGTGKQRQPESQAKNATERANQNSHHHHDMSDFDQVNAINLTQLSRVCWQYRV